MNLTDHHAGPYALGTLRDVRREFAGLVVGDRVRPITTAPVWSGRRCGN
jgi:hypothetical protein